MNNIFKKDNYSADQLIKQSKELRKLIINISHKARAHHIGSEFACIDILTVLYFRYMNINPTNLTDPDRDWFMLSKGHAALAQYVVLAAKGFFSFDDLQKEFLTDGGKLGGHPDRNSLPGIEMSSGSLGHGLSIGTGVALNSRFDNTTQRIFILLGDGECNEGLIWEAVLFAGHYGLDNLVAIIDYNRLQGFGKTDEILNLDPFSDKFKSFGWAVKEIDGHNIPELIKCFDQLPFEKGKPNCIIANTVKGKGSPFMENKLDSHYIVLNDELKNIILNELD